MSATVVFCSQRIIIMPGLSDTIMGFYFEETPDRLFLSGLVFQGGRPNEASHRLGDLMTF